MSYLAFHLVFILPPILLLALALPRRWAAATKRRRWSLPLVALIAFLYTTPWDNYLVYRGVWSYGSDRVLATVGYVPLEEYLFFLLQPFLTGLFLYNVLARRTQGAVPASGKGKTLAGTLGYLILALVGALLLLSGWERGLYLGLILAWAGPVLAGLWYFGGGLVRRMPRAFLLAVSLPTLYLWIADRTAIALGIWDIADRYSLGVDPLGLPIEEALFFLVTNLLVVQGLLLFLFPPQPERPETCLELQ